jgi:hypothetical protein
MGELRHRDCIKVALLKWTYLKQVHPQLWSYCYRWIWFCSSSDMWILKVPFFSLSYPLSFRWQSISSHFFLLCYFKIVKIWWKWRHIFPCWLWFLRFGVQSIAFYIFIYFVIMKCVRINLFYDMQHEGRGPPRHTHKLLKGGKEESGVSHSTTRLIRILRFY